MVHLVIVIVTYAVYHLLSSPSFNKHCSIEFTLDVGNPVTSFNTDTRF